MLLDTLTTTTEDEALPSYSSFYSPTLDSLTTGKPLPRRSRSASPALHTLTLTPPQPCIGTGTGTGTGTKAKRLELKSAPKKRESWIDYTSNGPRRRSVAVIPTTTTMKHHHHRTSLVAPAAAEPVPIPLVDSSVVKVENNKRPSHLLIRHKTVSVCSSESLCHAFDSEADTPLHKCRSADHLLLIHPLPPLSIISSSKLPKSPLTPEEPIYTSPTKEPRLPPHIEQKLYLLSYQKLSLSTPLHPRTTIQNLMLYIQHIHPGVEHLSHLPPTSPTTTTTNTLSDTSNTEAPWSPTKRSRKLNKRRLTRLAAGQVVTPGPSPLRYVYSASDSEWSLKVQWVAMEAAIKASKAVYATKKQFPDSVLYSHDPSSTATLTHYTPTPPPSPSSIPSTTKSIHNQQVQHTRKPPLKKIISMLRKTLQLPSSQERKRRREATFYTPPPMDPRDMWRRFEVVGGANTTNKGC